MLTPVQRVLLTVGILLGFILAGQLVAQWIRNAEKSKPNDQLVFGLIDDTPPYCFYNEENKLVGINIDLVNELGRRIGQNVKIESTSFNRLTAGLITRQYDVVSIGSITPHRAKVVRYVHPHLLSSDVLLVHPKLKHVKSLNEFKNQPWKIGVYNGTSYIQMLKDKGLEANMAIYPNQRDVFLAFYKRRVDGIIMNDKVASYIQHELDPNLIIVPEKVRTDRQYAFAVRKENIALWKKLDAAVLSVVADGTTERIHKKWLTQTASPSTPKGGPHAPG